MSRATLRETMITVREKVGTQRDKERMVVTDTSCSPTQPSIKVAKHVSE